MYIIPHLVLFVKAKNENISFSEIFFAFSPSGEAAAYSYDKNAAYDLDIVLYLLYAARTINNHSCHDHFHIRRNLFT